MPSLDWVGSLLVLVVLELYAWIPNPNHVGKRDHTTRSKAGVSFSMGEGHQLTDFVIKDAETFGTLCRNRSGVSQR